MNTKKARDTAWIPEWGFGDRLRKVRTDLGYKQEEFAELLDLNSATLSSYESGRANPRATALPALAARLELLTKVPRVWFMGWEAENPHQPPSGGSKVGPAGIEPTTFTVKTGNKIAEVIPLFGQAA